LKDLSWFKKLEVLEQLKDGVKRSSRKMLYRPKGILSIWEKGNIYPRKNSRELYVMHLELKKKIYLEKKNDN
jgi:hypothetical protein